MRLRRFFASVILMLPGVSGLCCGPLEFSPREYYMFRAYDKDDERLSYETNYQNCLAWQAATSVSIPIKDIYTVVYEYGIDMLTDEDDSNTFIRWIRSHSDREVLDFLVLAKSCELARSHRTSRWYYPSRNDEVLIRLENIRDSALAYKGERLRDRYALQAVRAMHSLGEYERIERWWDENKDSIKSGLIRDMTEGYVEGALLRLGKKEKAMQFALKRQDIKSIETLLSANGLDTDFATVLDFIAEHCPDNPNAPAFLQEKFHFEGPSEQGEMGTEEIKSDLEKEKYIAICLKAAKSPLCKKPALWYYTASYLEYLLGRESAAYATIRKAEASSGTPFIKESVKLLRIFFDSRHLRYDGSDDSRLLSDLKWMDSMICNNLTPEVRQKTSEDLWQIHLNGSFFYWGDMMRKVVLGEMVPRMCDAGRGRTAIALANMSDNRLVGRVDSYSGWGLKGLSYDVDTITMSQYRHLAVLENGHDYCNQFFNLMDTTKLSHLVRYISTVGAAQNPMDKFLDERGYVDMDYLNEVLGTRYLRNMDYANAVRVLSKVSPGYQYRTNLTPYMTRLPFEYGEMKSSSVPSEYKLSFAKAMLSYQQQAKSPDADKAGFAKVMMGIGLNSSFGYCWALTQYHNYTNDPWLSSEYTRKALAKAESLIESGMNMIQDRELEAECWRKFLELEYVVKNYPETRAAELVRTRCDEYKDYEFEMPGN